MDDENAGWGRRRLCLAFLAFLLVYLPLDAFDFDTSDTFDGGVVQVRLQTGEDAVNSLLHPAGIFLRIASAVPVLHGPAPVSTAICKLSITLNSFSLPRSDDPHVAWLYSLEFPAQISAV